MMQSARKVILIIIMLAMSVMLFSACSLNDKMTLMNALENTMKIKSMESKSKINLRIGISGIPDQDLEQIKTLFPLDENIKLQVNHKYIEDSSGLDSQIDFTVRSVDRVIDSSIWLQSNLANGKPQVREIIKLPIQASQFLPPEFAEKQYFVIDDSIMTGGESSADEFKKMMQDSAKFQQKLIDFLKEYAMNYDPGFASIKYTGIKNINGEMLKVYELKLTDASLKRLIKYTINHSPPNEKAKELLKELAFLMAGMSNSSGQGEPVEKALDKFRNGTSGFREDANKLMNALDSVQLLGYRGISAELGINEAGYIVSQKGAADIVFNFQAIEDAVRKASGDEDYFIGDNLVSPKVVLTLETDFDTQISKVNQSIDIAYPELTEENSFGLEDLMGLIPTPDLPEDGEFTEEPIGLIMNNK